MLDFILFYFLVGALFAGGYTAWVYWVAHKNDLNVQTNWFALAGMVLLWPYALFDLIRGLSKNGN